MEDFSLIVAGDVQVWVDKKTDEATQIMVHSGFEGKYAGTIGIGSTLNDVRILLNMTWHEELYVYILDQAPGMCFELGDSSDDDEEEWDELRASIDYISVYYD